jgi:hypothetical protein
MDIGQINAAIIKGKWTNDELTSMIGAIKFARSLLTDQNKRQLRLGSTVQFTSSKTGVTMRGTVNKIAIKYVTVATQQGLWKVPANMLEVA